MQYTPYLQQITNPSEEPISLSETKLFLRVSNTSEDSLISRLIIVARKVAENYIRSAIIQRNFRLTLRQEIEQEVFLPMGPVQSIIQVKSFSETNVQNIIASSNYDLIKGQDTLKFNSNQYSYLTEIEYISGFGSAANVPDDIKHGILLYVAGLYDERIDGIDIPRPCRIMFDAYRNISI
jgi:uncharacterized phiE125 gp8 family phage protein